MGNKDTELRSEPKGETFESYWNSLIENPTGLWKFEIKKLKHLHDQDIKNMSND